MIGSSIYFFKTSAENWSLAVRPWS